MTDVANLVVNIRADVSDMRKGMRGALLQVEALKVGLRAAARAFTFSAKAIAGFVKASSDADETMNLLREGFGSLTKETVEWAKALSKGVGRSQVEIREMAAAMQAMLAPMTGNRIEAAKMSKGLTELAIDLGSFFNLADTDALAKLRAGIAGETEPLRQLGVTMTQAALNAFAMSKGIKQSVLEMSEAEKVALRYEFILAKTEDAQGDAARTADGWENSTKALRASLKDTAVVIGDQLKPALLVGLQAVNKLARGFSDFVTNNASAIKFFVGVVLVSLVDGIRMVVGPITTLINTQVLAAQDLAKSVTVIAGALTRAAAAAKQWELAATLFDATKTANDLATSLGKMSQNVVKGGAKTTQAMIDMKKELIEATFELNLWNDATDKTKTNAAELGDMFSTFVAPIGGLAAGLGGASEALGEMNPELEKAAFGWDAVGAAVGAALGQFIAGEKGIKATVKATIAALAKEAAAFAATRAMVLPFPANIIAAVGAAAAAEALVSSFGNFDTGGLPNRGNTGAVTGQQLAVIRDNEKVVPTGGPPNAGGSGMQIVINQNFPTNRAELDKQVRDVFLPSLRRVGAF